MAGWLRTAAVVVSVLAALAPSSAAQESSSPARRMLEGEYAGTIVVLNFWASWCLPCRKEIPALARLQVQYGPRGVQIIGAALDEAFRRKEVEKLAHELGVNYPIRLDLTTAHMKELGLANAVPATALFDRDGMRVFRIIGEASEREISERLEWLLGKRTAPPPAELVLPTFSLTIKRHVFSCLVVRGRDLGVSYSIQF